MPLPEQTVIKFSKIKIVIFLLFAGILAAGFLFFHEAHNFLTYLRAVIFLLLGTVLSVLSFIEMIQLGKTQMIIGVKGITDSEGKFYSWQNISGEKLEKRGSGKVTYHLYFNTPEHVRKLHLNELNKSPGQIMSLIKQYREMNRQITNLND